DWSIFLTLLIAFGFAVVALHGLASLRVQAVAVGLALAGACLLGGVLLGFLFGIPRSLQSQSGDAGGSEQKSTPVANEPAGNSAERSVQSARSPQYGANTNLEQISDWLTKILVGAGLIQLTSAPGFLRRAGDYFGAGLAAGNVGSIFAITIILYFSVSGFLAGYVWTRLILGGMFAGADKAALALDQIQEIKKKREEQSQTDAKALSLVNQYLTDRQTDVDEMKQAIQQASAPIKVQIFYQARAARRGAKTAAEKPIMDRRRPIFESLADSDTSKMFHKNYGQWGYALLDSTNPDYAAAEKVLTTAINIRGESGGRYPLYEFLRAISRIKQDPSYAKGEASGSEKRKPIRDDLKVAFAADPDLKSDDVTK